jgi:hypothetical protein
MQLTRLVKACTFIVAACLCGPARAEDVARQDAYDILSMAIELDLRCTSLPYFEQRYLRVAADRAYEASSARLTVAASADRAQATADIAQAYRDRAGGIACQEAADYLSQGRTQAYAQLGQALLTAQALRGQAAVAPGFSPLTGEQRQLFAVFSQAGAQTFGADWGTMDAYIQQVATIRLQDLATKGEAARLIELGIDWGRAFATLRFQAAATAASYVPRLARLANGGEAIVMDGGTARPRLVVVAGPQLVKVPLLSGPALDVYSFFAVMPDGSALVALYGEGASALPAGIRQRLTEGVPVDGERLAQDCPFDACFRVAADRIDMLVQTFGGTYLKSLVTEWPTDAERESGGDRLNVNLQLLAAARQAG